MANKKLSPIVLRVLLVDAQIDRVVVRAPDFLGNGQALVEDGCLYVSFPGYLKKRQKPKPKRTKK